MLSKQALSTPLTTLDNACGSSGRAAALAHSVLRTGRVGPATSISLFSSFSTTAGARVSVTLAE